MTTPSRQFEFGPFRFLPVRQLLLAGDTPVRLGGRARDILTALLERPGEVVTKQELLNRVWPSAFVEEANLRVHVAALRKALADAGGAESRYITNVAGRGYCFVGDVAVSEERAAPPVSALSFDEPHDAAAGEVPEVLVARPSSHVVGRSEVIGTIVAQLLQHRQVTIVGPGGIGKTTVAVAIAEALLGKFRDGIHFVDLAPLTDNALAATALANVLGVMVLSDQAGRGLEAYLRDRHLLIILDNCEHIVEAAAMLAENTLLAGAGVHILATSREPLGARGERVHRLPPLPSPPDFADLTAAEACRFPAVQLFVDRATAKLPSFVLTDADARLVADLCRRLDGIALAIEIAAGWIDAFGVSGIVTLLDDRFRLQMRGRRTALPRHQTLFTTLDWSYMLLSEREKRVLQCLTAFAGVFSMEAAVALLTDTDNGPVDIIDAVANLVSKSLITASIDGAVAEYRLLEITRAFATLKLAESGGAESLAGRHARYYRDVLESAAEAWETRPAAEWLEGRRHLVDDVRAALDWSFGPKGDSVVGVALTIAAVPLWFQLSLINECLVRAQRARAVMAAEPEQDAVQAMRLDAVIAWSLMQVRGFVPETPAAWTRVLDAAVELEDTDHELRALWGLWASRMNNGELTQALALARRFTEVAARCSDQPALAIADRMWGWTLHLQGEQTLAREHLERMLASYVTPVSGAQILRFIFDQRITARCFHARVLWLQGFADQALANVDDVVEDALKSGDTLSLCQALVQAACWLTVLVGDLQRAERFVTMLTEYSTSQGLGFWQTWGRSFRGLLLVRTGDLTAGLRELEVAIGELRGMQFGVHFTLFLGCYAEGRARAGDLTDAAAALDEAVARAERNSEYWCMSHLLRVKGELALKGGDAEAAEDHLVHALQWARRQEAWSWELRAATDLAQLWQTRGRVAEARSLLAASYGRFTEGFATPDLERARTLLHSLQ